MLHHVSIGVSDVQRAAKFYDSVFSTLGYRRVMEIMPYGIAYGREMPQFWVQLPHNHSPSSSGNGTHIAFEAPSKAAVHAFHSAAIGAGGKDEGAPGPRPEYTPNYYGAFVRDPDGNKIEAVFLPMEAAKPAGSSRPKSRSSKPAKKAAPKKPGRSSAKARGTKPARRGAARR